MIHELTTFLALTHPVEMSSLGWYVGCVDIQYDEYYLHDNGAIYDTCAPRLNGQGSTGWFKTEVEAYIQMRWYYSKHGIKVPWASSVTADDEAESQVMEFI